MDIIQGILGCAVYPSHGIIYYIVQVVDRQTGQPVTGPDLQGELCVKTCQLLPGYLGQEESILDSEGYFHTGDLGYYDNTGVIHFVEQVLELNCIHIKHLLRSDFQFDILLDVRDST